MNDRQEPQPECGCAEKADRLPSAQSTDQTFAASPGVPGGLPAAAPPDVTTAVSSAQAKEESLAASAARHAGGAGAMSASFPEGRKLFVGFFLILLVFSLFLLYWLMSPFLHSIILACVFTAISYPLYQRCLNLTGGRRVPAAMIMILGITLIIAVLVTVFVTGLVPQAKSSIADVNQWLRGQHLSDALGTHFEPVLQWVREYMPELELSVQDIRDNLAALSSKAGQYLIASATSFLGNTLLFISHLLLTLLIMFFLFIDGQRLAARLAYLFPMKPAQTAVVMESLRKMSRAVLVGGFSVALLQGVVGGIGLYIVDIPGLFWGTVMVFAALVPVVGTGLVWVPAVIYLLLAGKVQSAIFLALWCGLLVTSIDSFLRPLLLRGGAKVPVLFLFMAILGGINVFGMLGLLYGPMILGLVAVMLDIYAEEYNDILQERAK